jgi:DNA-binding LacI/PurR family transcriptional regulator
VRRPTIRDVAEKAGVGKVTVSYVLNGQSRTARISEATEQKVLDAAHSLGYRPNALARMLVTKRTDVLAVVFQRGSYFPTWSSFTSEVMRGVTTAAVELGYDLFLHTKEVASQDEADVLADGRVDGVLVLRDEGDEVVRALATRGLPCVSFFCRASDVALPFVDADNAAGAKAAVEHLIGLGHRQIAMVRGPLRSTNACHRLDGYCDAMGEAGLPIRPDWVVSELDCLHALMKRPQHPTAVFVWSDDVAFQVLTMLRELGLRVPEDVSVVGFDSVEACNQSVPPLTSVRQPVFDMATTATRLLASLIRGQAPPETQVLFPLVLDIRGSTAPCHSSPTQRGA